MIKINDEIVEQLFGYDYLNNSINDDEADKLDHIAKQILNDNDWADVYRFLDKYMREKCKTEHDIINYVNLFLHYVGLDFRIPSNYNPYDLMGYLISKVDLAKTWNEGGEALDEFSIHALNVDLYRNPEYQFWNDSKVIEAAQKYGGIKHEETTFGKSPKEPFTKKGNK